MRTSSTPEPTSYTKDYYIATFSLLGAQGVIEIWPEDVEAIEEWKRKGAMGEFIRRIGDALEQAVRDVNTRMSLRY
jgi:hypothetical protein